MTRLNDEMIQALGDDALAEIAEGMLAESKILRDNSERARYELTRRLRDRRATQFRGSIWSGRLVPGGYVHAVENPIGLADALEEAGVESPTIIAAIHERSTVVVDHRVLNDLVKLGGAVREAVERFRQSEPGEPKLTLTRIADVPVESPTVRGASGALKGSELMARDVQRAIEAARSEP